jgi:hypothetical protein
VEEADSTSTLQFRLESDRFVTMSAQAAVINAHYARVVPQMATGTSVVSYFSLDKDAKLKSGEPVLFASFPNDHAMVFTEDGKVLSLAKPRELRTQDMSGWPNPAFTEGHLRDLRKQADGKNKILLYELEVGNLHPLVGPNYTLDRLAYSLKAVERYEKPIVHFQRQVRNLDTEDYTTIKNGQVYLARTAFAKIANALPLRNRLEFRLWIDKEFGYQPAKDIDYLKYLDLLLDYLESRIFSRGRLLIATDDMIRSSKVVMPEHARTMIGLADEEGNDDSIHEQANLFRPLLEKGKLEILRTLKTEVDRNTVEQSRFKRLFKNKPLPLILTEQ